jgi:hypothetical protein
MMAKAIHYYNIKGTLDRKVLMRECAGELEVMRRVQPEMYGGLVRVLGPL